jgi:hypothetical protein
MACLGPDPAPSPWGFVSGVGAQTGREVGGGQERDSEGQGWVQEKEETEERTETATAVADAGGRQGSGVGGGRGAQGWGVSARVSAVATRVACAAIVALLRPRSRDHLRRQARASSDHVGARRPQRVLLRGGATAAMPRRREAASQRRRQDAPRRADGACAGSVATGIYRHATVSAGCHAWCRLRHAMTLCYRSARGSVRP